MDDRFNPNSQGHITTEFTVWCGNCSFWEQISERKKDCIYYWKNNGWKLTKKYGWLCKDCYKLMLEYNKTNKKHKKHKDFLDEIVEERTKANPKFPKMTMAMLKKRYAKKKKANNV